METWFIFILSSLCIAALLRHILNSKPKRKLPPGPFAVPIISRYLWHHKSFPELEVILRKLHPKHGPIVSLPTNSNLTIFVASRSLAHQALIQHATIFADRPVAPATHKIISSDQHDINSARYGPTWRLLRRNLASGSLHPSRLKSYAHVRKWALGILIDRLQQSSNTGDGTVQVVNDFHFTMLCLLVRICYGDKLDEKTVKDIELSQQHVSAGYVRFHKLTLWPVLGKILFRKQWEEFLQVCKNRENVLIALIRARQQRKQEMQSQQKEGNRGGEKEPGGCVTAYVDSLLDLQLPEGKRKLNDGELVSLCSEFLNAGTKTTSPTLQWIMANLVKYPHIQGKLYEEISGIMGVREDDVNEEDLQKMPYLKVVVLEGLRRHPAGHFGVPHAVTEDVKLGGYDIPKNTTVFFMAAEIAWNPEVWEDPLEFKPERFLSGDGKQLEPFDISGTKEIKMMPFGAGRRMCPGYGLAIFHLEYFVANLIWHFEWNALDGDEVDLSECPFSHLIPVMMKNPLKAHISPRVK